MTMRIHTWPLAVAALLATLSLSAGNGKRQVPQPGQADTDGTYTYSGPRISLRKAGKERATDSHRFKSVYLGKLSGRKGKGFGYQGLDLYRTYALSCQNQGVASVYRINGRSITLLGQFELASFHPDNHANVANFGTAFYAEGDRLPLVYISQAQKKTINGRKDVLYVERIASDLQSSTLVQTIVFDDPEHLFGYALQWAIDKEQGFLYGYGNTVSNEDPANRHRIMKFKMPTRQDTDKDGFVVLREEDALENYLLEDVSDFRGNPIGQGLTIAGGKLFMPTGFGTEKHPSILYVWDLRTRTMSNVVDLTKATRSELEDCGVYRNRLVLQSQDGLFSLKF